MSLDRLKELDERIQLFLEKVEKLRRENQALAERATESDRRLAEMSAQLKQLDGDRRQHENERVEIKNRIEKLLERLNGLDFA
ncbi:MAG TPA: cell division protein ZapB [Candidatus Binataceae bacterium]|nr:cell division protein ZapB [Candidatus Binataceae bacterium]